MRLPNQAGNTVVIVILLILVGAGLVFAGYYLGIGQQPPPVKTTETQIASPSASLKADPTAGWKTYTDQMGFSFKYPPDWTVSGGQAGGCDKYVLKDGRVMGETIPNATCYRLEVRSPNDDGLSIVYGTKQFNTTFSEIPDSPAATNEYTETRMIPLNGLTIPRDLVVVKQFQGQSVDFLSGARYNNWRPIWFGDLGFWFTFGSTVHGPFARKDDIETADVILSTFTIPPSVVR